MESPFQLRQAFGADGIGFQEYDKDGNVTRCTRYQSFTPWRNADLTNLDMLRDNQWSREEKSLGPRTAIRPSINDSSSYNLVYDADKIGVLCFYDKLYVAFYSQYIANSTGKFDFIDTYYDFMFVPRKVSRMDYLQHLIGRIQCNPKPCIKQTFKEWPCIGSECHFSDPQEGDENSVEDMVWYKTRKGEEIKLKKKDLLNDEPLPKPCFNVCQDKVCPPPSEVCKEYIDNLTKCQDQLKGATSEIISLKAQIKDLKAQLDAANAEITRLKTPEVKRNIRAYTAVNYWVQLLNNSNETMRALMFKDYEETYNRLQSALKSGQAEYMRNIWKQEDKLSFGAFQSIYTTIRDSLGATSSEPTKRIGYMYATFIKLACNFAMFGTCNYQEISPADADSLRAIHNKLEDLDIFIIAFTRLNELPFGEVKYIKPKLFSDFYFQAAADKKTCDSGFGSTQATEEESSTGTVPGVNDPRDGGDSHRGGDDASLSSDKENENDPERMDESTTDLSPSQGL